MVILQTCADGRAGPARGTILLLRRHLHGSKNENENCQEACRRKNSQFQGESACYFLPSPLTDQQVANLEAMVLCLESTCAWFRVPPHRSEEYIFQFRFVPLPSFLPVPYSCRRSMQQAAAATTAAGVPQASRGAPATSSFAPPNRVVCSVHNVLRIPAYMIGTADGVFKCREGQQCTTTRRPLGATDRDDVICDLCMGPIPLGAQEPHLAVHHPHLMRYVEDIGEKAAALQALVANAQQRYACDEDRARKLGGEVCRHAQAADGGQYAYDIARAAHQQLAHMVRNFRNGSCHVLVFGSIVALGCWDGEGDVDFTVVDIAHWRARKTPVDDEPKLVNSLCAVLRAGGFQHDELEPLTHTRVPIVKHVPLAGYRQLHRLSDVQSRTLIFEIAPGTTGGRGSASAPRKVIDDKAKADIWKVLYDGDVQQATWQLAGLRTTLEVEYKSTTLAVKSFCSTPFSVAGCAVRPMYSSSRYLPDLFQLDFDVSFRAFGFRNSLLLRRYFEQRQSFRAGSVYIKRWSKQCGVNLSKKGFLTSYAFNLLWIYYLLQSDSAKFVDPRSLPELPEETDDPTRMFDYMALLPPSEKRHTFEVEVGQLVAGFFAFYTWKFDWHREVVSVSRPRVTTKDSLQWTLPNERGEGRFRDRVWYRGCIEDPYEANLNLARHLSPVKLQKLCSEFQRAAVFIYGGPSSGDGDRGEWTASSLLLSRTTDALTPYCQLRSLPVVAGQSAMTMEAYVQGLERECGLDVLAAFETGFPIDRLIFVPWYSDGEGGGAEGGSQIKSVRLHDHSKMLKFTDVSHCRMLIEAFDSCGSRGLVQNDPRLTFLPKALVDDIFYFGHGRYFLSQADVDQFGIHLDFATRTVESLRSGAAGDDPSVRVADVVDAAKASRMKESLVLASLENSLVFQRRSADTVALVATPPAPSAAARPQHVPDVAPATQAGSALAPIPHASPPLRHQGAAAAPPPPSGNPVRDTSRPPPRGRCHQCNARAVFVWPATNFRVDSGHYCDGCWKMFEQ
mgnify:CR=1 FL=1